MRFGRNAGGVSSKVTKVIVVILLAVAAWVILGFNHTLLKGKLVERSSRGENENTPHKSNPHKPVFTEPTTWEETPLVLDGDRSTWKSDRLADMNSRPTKGNTDSKWLIAVPDEDVLENYDATIYQGALQEGWKVLLVVDDAAAIKEKIVTEENNGVIIIDLLTPFFRAQRESAAAYKSVSLQKDPDARKRIYGYLYAIAHAASIITTIGNGGFVFGSGPRLQPERLEISPIDTDMFIPGKMFADPYGAMGRKEVTPSHPIFDYVYRWFRIIETKFELGPQRLFSPIQKFIPYSASYDKFQREDIFATESQLTRDTTIAIPEGTFSLLTPDATAFYHAAFWALPITGMRSEGSNGNIGMNEVWGLWVQRLLFEIGGRVSYSNSTIFDYLRKPMYVPNNVIDNQKSLEEWRQSRTRSNGPADIKDSPSVEGAPNNNGDDDDEEEYEEYLNRIFEEAEDEKGSSSKGGQEQEQEQEENSKRNERAKRAKEKASDEKKKQGILDAVQKMIAWRFTSTKDAANVSFFDVVWRFSIYLYDNKLVSLDDLKLLQAWLEDIVILNYEIPSQPSAEQFEVIREREAHLGERLLIGDAGGWGLNNQRDNIICSLAIGSVNNYTVKLPDVYTMINAGGQPFYWWNQRGEVAGWGGIEKLPIEPFNAFWDGDFLINNLKDLVRIVKTIPRYIEFNNSDVGMPLVPPMNEKYKYFGDLKPNQQEIWKEYMRNRHVLYLQNPFGITLWQIHMMTYGGETLYYRRRLAASLKISSAHQANIDYAFNVLQETVKPFFKGGRYMCLHWNRQHGMYSGWGTQDQIPSEHYATVVNRYFRRVINLPPGYPIFIFGAGINTKEDVPVALYEGFSLITVNELFPGLKAVDERKNLNQMLPLYNFEIGTRAFMYFCTNSWSTFDLEVCFMRHRIRGLSKDTVDICHGLPRNWRYAADTIDPLTNRPLKDVVAELKDLPMNIFDPDVYPTIEPTYQPEVFPYLNIPFDLDALLADPWAPSPEPVLAIEPSPVIDLLVAQPIE